MFVDTTGAFFYYFLEDGLSYFFFEDYFFYLDFYLFYLDYLGFFLLAA